MNRRLIEAVFTQLQSVAPAGLSYAVFCSEDGHFFHCVQTADGVSSQVLSSQPAFKTFLQDLGQRCATPVERSAVLRIGSYGKLEQP
ncbi:MAG TPA: hypothetical protein VGM81_13820 [Burkholderiaceae bacterium]